MNNSLNKNIIANYVGKIWSFISVYLFIPLYIKFLGIESYAIINFYTILLSIMLVADAGLSATLNRELARTDDKFYLGNLLRTIEYVYSVIAIIIFLLIFSFSSVIAERWLNSETISVEKISLYVKLMGGCIAFQLLSILYNSGLMGLQKQVLSNSIQVSSSFFRLGIVIVPIFFFRDLTVFFAWQLFSNFIFFLIPRHKLWSFIKTNRTPIFDRKIFQSVGKFALGMMLMSVIASTNTQIDKVFVSKIMSLKAFGYYSLAGVFAQIATMFILPIAVAILPKMTRLAEEKNNVLQKVIFHRYSFIVASLGCAITTVLILYTKDFIYIWTNDMLIANSITNVTRILLVGGAFLALQYMPYHLAIANGHTKSNIFLGIIMVIFVIPLLYFFINKYGLIGASYPWAILNVFAAFFLGFVILKRYLPGSFMNWLLKDTFIPVIFSASIGIIAYFVTRNIAKGLNVLILGSIVGGTIMGLNILFYIKFYLNTSLKKIVKKYVS